MCKKVDVFSFDSSRFVDRECLETWFRRRRCGLVDDKKSMVCEAYGSPLVLRENMRRELVKGEVRIKTEYAGINYAGRIVKCWRSRFVGLRGEVPREVASSVHSGFGGVWSCD